MYKIYTVEQGDTLYIIADKVGITPEELKKINGIQNDNQIIPGIQLIVPASENLYFKEYVIQKGDNIYDIAKKNNVNYVDLIKVNGLNVNDYIYPGQRILIPNKNVKIYVTNPNDTLQISANELGTTTNTLVEQNKEIFLIPDQLIVYKQK